jgi:ABC-type amino acid transport substrate-binding protein
MDYVLTKCGDRVEIGQVAWNYYDGHAVMLVHVDDPEGFAEYMGRWGLWNPVEPYYEIAGDPKSEKWIIDFRTHIDLDGERVCSLQTARDKDWTTDRYPNEGSKA